MYYHNLPSTIHNHHTPSPLTIHLAPSPPYTIPIHHHHPPSTITIHNHHTPSPLTIHLAPSPPLDSSNLAAWWMVMVYDERQWVWGGDIWTVMDEWLMVTKYSNDNNKSDFNLKKRIDEHKKIFVLFRKKNQLLKVQLLPLSKLKMTLR